MRFGDPLNPPSGIVVTSWPDLDRETRDEYLVVIQVQDMLGLSGGYSSSTTLTVILTDVNDNGPTFQRRESLPPHRGVCSMDGTVWVQMGGFGLPVLLCVPCCSASSKNSKSERDGDALLICVWTFACATHWMNLIIHTWADICHDLWKQTKPSQG